MRTLLALFAVIFATVTIAPQAAYASPAWKCAKNKCFWVEYSGAVPDYAAAWGPPREPGCYYKQGAITKRWRQVCAQSAD